MSRTPTEEDLGIEMTPAEQAILDAPQITAPEDDIRPDDDEDDSLIAAKPKPERVKDPATGKFVAKEPVGPGDGSRPEVVAPAAGNKPPPGFVDTRALQESRAENRVLTERMNVLLETMNRREAKAEAKENPPPAKPDIDLDPKAYVESLEQRLARFENESAEQTQQREAQEAEARSYSEAVAYARPQFEQAAQTDPLIKAQYSELLASYAKEIVYLNQANPEFVKDPRGFLGRAMTKLEGDHIRYAQQTNRPLATYIKGLAESRGINAAFIQAKIAQQPPAGQQQQAEAGRSIPDRRAAQARHMSVGDLPGGASPTTINAKDLVKMSNKDFAAFAKKMGDDGMDELFLKAN